MLLNINLTENEKYSTFFIKNFYRDNFCRTTTVRQFTKEFLFMKNILSMSFLLSSVLFLSAPSSVAENTLPQQLKLRAVVQLDDRRAFSRDVILQRTALDRQRAKYSGYVVNADGSSTGVQASAKIKITRFYKLTLNFSGLTLITEKHSLESLLGTEIFAKATEWSTRWDYNCNINSDTSGPCLVHDITAQGSATISVIP